MTSTRTSDLEIAIIGMAGRFPGAPTVDALWRNLREGVESIRDLSDEEIRAAGVDEATLADPRFVRRAADLQGAELFDAALFGFTPREAELLDPQFRVFLEDAWAALENAAALTDRHDRRVGVFAGASGSTYLHNNVLTNPTAAEAVGAFQTSIGNERDYLAPHISYRLDLRGPSLVVQTACSTSLAAVHMACQSLLGRECDIAVAGGVSISVPQTAGYIYEEGGIASPDGRCRAFDEAAAGCVKGNGSGVVVLKRLEDALRDGDTIRAVIKGSAMNNDGSLKVGFTAPSEEGQAGVIAEALAAAGVEPETIGYVEAHGTATSLGDPVEVAALARAFGATARGNGPCAIGSIKTNIGHLDAAAGIAGLIKTVLALEHREIPPSLHFERANTRIDFAGGAFRVNAQLREWASPGTPRRAGVSSFGIGGTNVHVVLEEAPERSHRAERARAAQVIVLSAATETALAASSGALAAWLDSGEASALADAAATLQVGRKRLPWRRALIVRDAAEAIAFLRGSGGRGAAAGKRDERRGSQVAFLFPGQGAQFEGMAQGLVHDEPVFRDAIGRCAEILAASSGLDLAALLRGPGGRAAGGPADRRGDEPATTSSHGALRDTTRAQPALFAVEYALARLWMSWGVHPSAMAGHSIGEYVAACIAGVMSLEDALGLVAERGRLMGAMPAGTMLAAALGEADLAALLREHPALSLAAVNGVDACVASGPEAAIAQLESRLDAGRIPHKRLHTSHAFHSAMMDPVVGAFEERVRRAKLSPPRIPFVSNVTGTWITPAQATDSAYWSAHLRRTVRFADALALLASDPSRVLLEVGPGTTLASLARRCAGPEATIVASLRSPKATGEDTHAVLEAVGELWCAGVDVDWEAFHEGFERRRVAMPGYPFERRRFWIEPGKILTNADFADASRKNPDLAAWFYVPGWTRALARSSASEPEPAWLLLDDGSDLGRALAALASGRGARVITVRPGTRFARTGQDTFEIDPRRREQFDELLRALRSDGPLPERVVHLWVQESAPLQETDAQDLGFFALLHLLQAMGDAGATGSLRIAAVASGLFSIAGEPTAGSERATLVGPCRVAPQEYAGLRCRLVDPGVPAHEARHETRAPHTAHVTHAVEAARAVAAELDTEDREPVVAWRGGYRWTPSHAKVRLSAPDDLPDPIRKGGVYVLTGGAGPLEAAIVGRLAAAGARAVVVLEPDVDAASGLRALREAPEVRDAGVEIAGIAAPGLDPDRLAAAFSETRARFGRVDGVFHTAAPIGGGMIQLKDRAAAERVLAPRLAGARALAAQLREGETLVLFSSAVSATGVFGQVDYCAASAFLDALAQSRRGAAGPRIVALDWGTAHWDRWQEAVGPGSEALLEALREIQSSVGITIDEGIDALWRALALGEPQVVVSTQDLDALVRAAASASVTELLEGIGHGAASGVELEGRSIVPLASQTEVRVAGVWSDLLGIAKIGRTDNFFELGGNSLLAIQLASHLRRVFEVDLTIASLFEAADLASLAVAVDQALQERKEAEEVARLLDEIEALSESQIRDELARSAGAPGGE